MLWPNCSFGLVMWAWPCATAAMKTSGRAAARQGRSLRLSIEETSRWDAPRERAGLIVLVHFTRRQPRALRRAQQGAYRAVKTLGPESVIATVCSKCAEREPSTVTIVHLSESV